MADDLVKVKPQLIERYRVVLSLNISRVQGVYLLDKKSKSDELGEHPGPFTWLAPHYIAGEKIVQTVGRSHILFWDKDDLLPMDTFSMLGEVFSRPNHSHDWLETYYGPDYMTRDANWSWLFNSHNHINLEELGIC
jgi:hypothetical protein